MYFVTVAEPEKKLGWTTYYYFFFHYTYVNWNKF